MKTFPADASVAVGQDTRTGRYVVIFTIQDLPSEAFADTVRTELQAVFADKVRELGGKLEGFELRPLPKNIVRG